MSRKVALKSVDGSESEDEPQDSLQESKRSVKQRQHQLKTGWSLPTEPFHGRTFSAMASHKERSGTF